MSQDYKWHQTFSYEGRDFLEILNSNVNNDDEMFESLVVLEFSVKVPPPSIQWILDKIKLVKSKGGSELLVCPIVSEHHEVC